ncbi:hypothetical protein [uncultured Litoreibacter sp.]|uniref:hypothetical protein n=1 Tax=uncultured Litoreibacter sp. TaxID=1392394 RepID=UPI00260BB1A6|nr:hypothetical protein [uncultured Litoreibacter sp.]
MSWIDTFLGGGPEYAAEDWLVADMQNLLAQACLGAGLPTRQAEDMAGMSALLMSDPKLFAIAVAALEPPHFAVRAEGTTEHLVIESARIVMAASVMTDAFADGASRVVLHDLDWPQLVWPVLLQAENFFGCGFAIDRPDARTVMVSRSRSRLKPLGEPQPVPLVPLAQLHRLAAKARLSRG